MPEKTCPVCGKSFTPLATRKKQVYCSPDCGYMGRKKTKEEAGKKRVDEFIDRLLDMEILDVLDGRLEQNATNNRMTVRGARTWESSDVEYLVLVKRRNRGEQEENERDESISKVDTGIEGSD